MSEYGWTERATLSKSSEVHSRQYWRTLEEQSKHTFYLFQLGGGAVGRWGMGEMGVGWGVGRWRCDPKREMKLRVGLVQTK